MSYKEAKAHLEKILDNLFGDRSLTTEEFNSRFDTLADEEEKIMEAGWLTLAQILRIEEAYEG